MQARDLIRALLRSVLNLTEVEDVQLNELIELSESSVRSDYTISLCELSHLSGHTELELCTLLTEAMGQEALLYACVEQSCLQIRLDRDLFSQYLFDSLQQQPAKFGTQSLPTAQHILIDMSSPNVGRHMTFAHLRSTLLGQTLEKVLQKRGYQTTTINHLGDWGTHFGRLLLAMQLWGDAKALQEDPMSEFSRLEVAFYTHVRSDVAFENQAREVYGRLLQGDEETVAQWQLIKDVSWEAFQKVYQPLGVVFDSVVGESFYNGQLTEVIELLLAREIAYCDHGAVVVDLEEGLPTALIQRSDGTSLYLTRDIATALYRNQTYQFERCLYIVGNEQINHFEQLKAVLAKLNQAMSRSIWHVPYGYTMVEGLSSVIVEGRIVGIEVLFEQLASRLQPLSLAFNEDDRQALIKSSLVFGVLSAPRMENINLSLDKETSGQPVTGPYVQLVQRLARQRIATQSLAKEVNLSNRNWQVIRHLAEYPAILQQVVEQYEPALLTTYLTSLAALYEASHEQADRQTTQLVNDVLLDGLALLGLSALSSQV